MVSVRFMSDPTQKATINTWLWFQMLKTGMFAGSKGIRLSAVVFPRFEGAPVGGTHFCLVR